MYILFCVDFLTKLILLENVTACGSEGEFYTGNLILYCTISLSWLHLCIVWCCHCIEPITFACVRVAPGDQIDLRTRYIIFFLFVTCDH